MRFWIGFMCMLGVMQAGENLALSSPSVEKPLVLIMMGPPGAGKGTHAKPVGLHFGIPHISTGDLFRENIRNLTPTGVKAKVFIDAGKLVSDDCVLEMLFDRIAQPDCLNGYVLDGFPRTKAQAEALEKKLKNCRIVALNLNVVDSLLIERISGRLACSDCGKSYHKKYSPQVSSMKCDDCKGSLFQRDDDKEEILKKRLEVYRVETEPLIDYFGKQKGVLIEIDAGGSPQEVFNQVLEALEPNFKILEKA